MKKNVEDIITGTSKTSAPEVHDIKTCRICRINAGYKAAGNSSRLTGPDGIHEKSLVDDPEPVPEPVKPVQVMDRAKQEIVESPELKEPESTQQIINQQALIARFNQPYIDTWGSVKNNENLILIPYDFSRRAQGVLILSSNAKKELRKLLEGE